MCTFMRVVSVSSSLSCMAMGILIRIQDNELETETTRMNVHIYAQYVTPVIQLFFAAPYFLVLVSPLETRSTHKR